MTSSSSSSSSSSAAYPLWKKLIDRRMICETIYFISNLFIWVIFLFSWLFIGWYGYQLIQLEQTEFKLYEAHHIEKQNNYIESTALQHQLLCRPKFELDKAIHYLSNEYCMDVVPYSEYMTRLTQHIHPNHTKHEDHMIQQENIVYLLLGCYFGLGFMLLLFITHVCTCTSYHHVGEEWKRKEAIADSSSSTSRSSSSTTTSSSVEIHEYHTTNNNNSKDHNQKQIEKTEEEHSELPYKRSIFNPISHLPITNLTHRRIFSENNNNSGSIHTTHNPLSPHALTPPPTYTTTKKFVV